MYTNDLNKISEEDKTKTFRPNYTVTEINFIELLNYYYPTIKQGEIQYILEKINIANITIDDLEYVSEMILPHLQIIWDAYINSYPTQANIIDYALESFFHFNWDNSEKEYARKRIIEEIKEKAEKQNTLVSKKSYHTTEYIKNNFVKNLHIRHINFEDDYKEPYWSDSPFYNDDLDWNEQSEEFYNDVL
jgi:hypothetical protein